MGKEKTAVASPLVRELIQVGIYKRSQGRITRQVTAAAIIIIVGFGAWKLSVMQGAAGASRFWELGVPVILWLIGCWLAYRLVNLPSFADFLIAVEAEMNKVSWPTRSELVRSVIVVIISILLLTVTLWSYDLFWRLILVEVLRVLG